MDADYIISMRRYFHKNPELSFHEYKTADRIEEELKGMGLKPERITETGIICDINGSSKGNTVALRADIDALPVNENSGDEFASKNNGVMHACGHDAHTAMLLGIAKYLSGHKSFKGKIRLIFQPAEETPPGGAIEMIENGALDDVDYIIGQHLLSTLKAGTVGINYEYGAAMADQFSIKISGPGGHASRPDESSDTIYVASLFIVSAQSIISRMVDQTKPSVLTFGTLNGGDRFNIIASTVEITGTVRAYNRELREKIRDSLKGMLSHICSIYGSEYEFEYVEGYPALLNDRNVAKVINKIAIDVAGSENVVYPDPSMGGEDFSRYLEKVPGAFYRLGVGNKEKGIDAPPHSSKYRIDESALTTGASVMLLSAMYLLEHGTKI